jgi:hypothetical protein
MGRSGPRPDWNLSPIPVDRMPSPTPCRPARVASGGRSRSSLRCLHSANGLAGGLRYFDRTWHASFYEMGEPNVEMSLLGGHASADSHPRLGRSKYTVHGESLCKTPKRYKLKAWQGLLLLPCHYLARSALYPKTALRWPRFFPSFRPLRFKPCPRSDAEAGARREMAIGVSTILREP